MKKCQLFVAFGSQDLQGSKIAFLFATWLSRQIFGHHQMMEALQSHRQPMLSHTVDNLNKKGCNVKIFMSISIQIQIQ